MKFVFNKPFTFEGTEYTEIDLKLDDLTGSDISKVKSQWALEGKFAPVPGADMDFCAMLACKAAGLPYEFAGALPGKEYIRLTSQVSNFLLQ